MTWIIEFKFNKDVRTVIKIVSHLFKVLEESGMIKNHRDLEDMKTQVKLLGI